MKAGNSTIRVVDASGKSGIVLVKDLFRAYAEEFADTIAETLCFQGFDAEVAGLLRTALGVPLAGDG